MITRQRRCLPVESESSEDVSSENGRLRSSSSPNNFNSSESSNTSQRYNMRKRSKAPVVNTDEASNSEAEEIVHPPRHGSMRALSDYETCNSSDSVEEEISPQRFEINEDNGNETDSSSGSDDIQTTSGKRCIRLENSSSTDSSDSGVPVGFQRRKKRMKLCSRSTEDVGDDDPIIAINNIEASQERLNRANTSRFSGRLRSNRSRSESNNDMTHISVTLNDGWSMSVGNVENDNWSVRMSQNSSDSESDDSDIRPRLFRNHTRRVFQNNSSSSSSSDSEDEIPIRRPRNRRIVKQVIESDNDDKSENENLLTESDDASEVCPICLNRFNLQVIGKPSNCDHCFCLTCIKEWAGNKNTCPVDRQRFTSIRVHSSIHSSFIEEIPVLNAQRINNEWGIGGLLQSDDNDSIISIHYNGDDFEEDDLDVCCVCLGGSRNSDMLFCNVCCDVYHLRCIDPPIFNFPAGPWLCGNCVNIVA